MSKKKQEAFSIEMEVLRKAKEVVEDSSLPEAEIRTEFTSFIAEFEKLLEEARFLTKVSDKLEAKLRTHNEKLSENNKELEQNVDTTKAEKEVILKKNQKLYQEKTQGEISRNKLQLTLLMLLAAVVILIIMFFYYIFWMPHQR